MEGKGLEKAGARIDLAEDGPSALPGDWKKGSRRTLAVPVASTPPRNAKRGGGKKKKKKNNQNGL